MTQARMNAKLAELKLAFVNANPLIRHQIGHVVIPLTELLGEIILSLPDGSPEKPCASGKPCTARGATEGGE